MIIEDIKKHLESSCPDFYGKRLNVNCLGEKIGSLSLKTVPCKETIREYADGGSLKQYVFEVCLRSTFDNDAAENIRITAFMESVKNWFCSSAKAQEMQFSTPDAFPIEYEVLRTQEVSHTERSGAEHSIRVRLIYEQK